MLKNKQFVYLSFCFMMLVWFCCTFSNAASTYKQIINEFGICIFFALIVYGTWEKGWISLKKIALAAFAFVVIFIVGIIVTGSNFEKRNMVLLAGVVFLLWVPILIQTIHQIKKQGLPSMKPSMVITFGALVVSMIITRNGRYWPLMLLFPVGIWLLQDLSTKVKTLLIESFSVGTILTFLATTGLALLFRPFDRTRYFGMFRTVCNFSFFLCLVIVALLIQYGKARHKNWTIKSLLLPTISMGVVLSFLFLSATRSAYLAMIIVLPGYFILMHFCSKQDTLKQLSKKIVLLILISVISFPVVFLAARWMPTVLHHPYWFEGDYDDSRIMSFESPTSKKYTTFYRFFKNLDSKLEVTDADGSVTLIGETVSGSQVTTNTQTNTVSQATADTQTNTVSQATTDTQTTDAQVSSDATQTAIPNEITKLEEDTLLGKLEIFANNRFHVYYEYSKQLDLDGHELDQLVTKEGEIIVHAHNHYLQAFFNFGALTGILFLIYCAVVFVQAILYYLKNKDEDEYAIIPLLMISIFGIVGITENCLQPFYPLTFFFYFIQNFIIRKERTTCK